LLAIQVIDSFRSLTKSDRVNVLILDDTIIGKNRNNKKEWLTILCTDLSLSDQEVVRIYGNRWSIEVFFKSAKSFIKLDGLIC
jgi:hypothetical protein